MWINYSDSEVNTYHPLCETALKLALKELRLSDSYSVIHHQYAGSLEMDYVIENNSTKKILCVVEVKRTPNDVQSTRFQYQAMSYIQQLFYRLEKPYYLITNLEKAYSFRYDNQNPQPYQQMLSPGLISIGDFSSSTNSTEHIKKLVKFFKKYISNVMADNYEYYLTLTNFSNLIEDIKDSDTSWKSNIAVLLYEYIRGSFYAISRFELRDIRAFNNNLKKICLEASKINFSQIFNFDYQNYPVNSVVDNRLLESLFNFAKTNINGDLVSNIIHSVISEGNEHNGEVSTDPELAKFASLLAKLYIGEIDESDYICDPAAGSGNLLESAISVFNIEPKQIIANDVNRKYSELLSLRLGLSLPNLVKIDNSPKVYSENLADLDKSLFTNVKVILVNPPYLAGIYSAQRKNELVLSMETKLNFTSELNFGQMGLECIFIEYLTRVSSNNSVISCIMPKQLLVSRGPEAIKFREFLLNRFGLSAIFNYPGSGLFDSVTKDTVILVGQKGKIPNKVSSISCLTQIVDIDSSSMFEYLVTQPDLPSSYRSIIPGVEAMNVNRQTLAEGVIDGWRFINTESIEAINFCRDNLFSNEKLIPFNTITNLFNSYRGTIGNSGLSDLLFFNSSHKYSQLYEQYKLLTQDGISALRNSDSLDQMIINQGDSVMVNWNNPSLNASICSVIDDYLQIPLSPGKQLKKLKNHMEISKILIKSTSKLSSQYSIAIPRDLRRNGRVFFATVPMYFSTNFVVIEISNFRDGVIIASWISSVFYQLICEISSKDNEGTRKMEIADLDATYIVNPNNINDDLFNRILHLSDSLGFIDLQNPEPRDIDILWAKFLFHDDWETKLEKSVELLSNLATKRNL